MHARRTMAALTETNWHMPFMHEHNVHSAPRPYWAILEGMHLGADLTKP